MARYHQLYSSGKLEHLARQLVSRLGRCELCPRGCHADRLAEKPGKCRTGRLARVYVFHPHFGEESPLVGANGSGTIFFANCSLRCTFCQNWEISQEGEGQEVPPESLARMMLSLQAKGCHNINLVTPTHVVPQILEALVIAVRGGLSVPLVYNSGGYDSVETLQLLDGAVDIYMPDMKYSDEAIARRLSGVNNYPDVNRAAIKEMHRQVGDLQLDERGIAISGLLVRHLVLPFGQAGTKGVVDFLAREISPDTYLNVMAQYRPCHRAMEDPLLNRSPRRDEFEAALRVARDAGLRRLDAAESPFAFRVLSR
ncbi:MAG: radical SAM protein [Chloroflexi bacterium]|nr:radical SAM protein [Chloroflexota bacterium]